MRNRYAIYALIFVKHVNPVIIGAGYSPILGGNVTMPATIYGMKQLANNVTGVVVPNSGRAASLSS
jgi:hypothetical protein